MDTKAFQHFVIANGIIGFFESPITLKSGRQSNFYVNWRRATNDAYLLDQLTDAIAAYLTEKGMGTYCVYGVPEGATKTAVIASMKLAKAQANFKQGSHVISMGRVKPKAHGTPEDRNYIGMPLGPTVVLEDTITTGGSLYGSLDQLLADGVQVKAVLSLTDRNERDGEGKSFADHFIKKYPGVAYHAMSEARTLLPLAFKLQPPAPRVKEAVMRELAQHAKGVF